MCRCSDPCPATLAPYPRPAFLIHAAKVHNPFELLPQANQKWADCEKELHAKYEGAWCSGPRAVRSYSCGHAQMWCQMNSSILGNEAEEDRSFLHFTSQMVFDYFNLQYWFAGRAWPRVFGFV